MSGFLARVGSGFVEETEAETVVSRGGDVGGGGGRGGGEGEVVALAAVPQNAVRADLDLGGVAEVRLVEVLSGDGERCELGERGGRAEAPVFDVGDFVV